jgi:hypothetical protein
MAREPLDSYGSHGENPTVLSPREPETVGGRSTRPTNQPPGFHSEQQPLVERLLCSWHA